ncbi:MAG TPA: NUDIX domain-containing protein [Candidatus Saccharimonadales bacterium]|nr:NUDIX domain-containing protein [Candidatus Saccharimonadales bacterium]
MEDVFHLGIKGLITNQKGEVLLLQANPAEIHGANDGKTYWDLPGGRIKRGESVEATLAREIAEETGITQLTRIKPLGMTLSNLRLHVHGHSDTVGLVLAVYECDVPKGSEVQLSHEHIGYEWVSKQRAAKLLRTKFSKEFCDLLATL